MIVCREEEESSERASERDGSGEGHGRVVGGSWEWSEGRRVEGGSSPSEGMSPPTMPNDVKGSVFFLKNQFLIYMILSHWFRTNWNRSFRMSRRSCFSSNRTLFVPTVL